MTDAIETVEALTARLGAEDAAATEAEVAGDHVTASACKAVADAIRAEIAARDPAPAKKVKRGAETPADDPPEG